ncbi:MAG: hypothetical protein LVQ95_03655 [Candidatus Micrarchaeales archaeon]|nr:hypothetical protein [Candidatus Micrarchaeales archaeon]
MREAQKTEPRWLDYAPLQRVMEHIAEAERLRFGSRLSRSRVNLTFARKIADSSWDGRGKALAIKEYEAVLERAKADGKRRVSASDLEDALQQADMILVCEGLAGDREAAALIKQERFALARTERMPEAERDAALSLETQQAHLYEMKKEIVVEWLAAELIRQIKHLLEKESNPIFEAERISLDARLNRLTYEVFVLGLDPFIRLNIEQLERTLEIEKSEPELFDDSHISGLEQTLREMKARAEAERSGSQTAREMAEVFGRTQSGQTGREDNDAPASCERLMRG